MNKIWRFTLAHQSIIYKFLLVLFSCFLIVYLFPKGGTFKYEFQKGKTWQYPSLFAPFDFSIIKSDEELEAEKLNIFETQSRYYRVSLNKIEDVKKSYEIQFSNFLIMVNHY